MKNVVTFETARALKDAGFPQPEPEAGQVWYIPTKTPGQIFITHIGEYYIHYAWGKNYEGNTPGSSKVNVESFFGTKPILAATSTDILRELPETALLSRIENDWQCRIMSYDEERCEYAIRNTNPAEACAAAYLEINKNRQP